MRRSATIVFALLASTVLPVLAPRAARAQQTSAADARRWAVGLALDMSELPDELTSKCGNTTDRIPSIGGGMAVLFHARSWLLFESDTRGGVTPDLGCPTNIPAAPEAPGNVVSFANRDFGRVPSSPLLRSAFRLGFETPGGEPVARATIGGGVLWSSSLVPFESATIGLGSGGDGIRFSVSLEMSRSRVRVMETRIFLSRDSIGGPASVSQQTTPLVLHPSWSTLNLGLELPVRRK